MNLDRFLDQCEANNWGVDTPIKGIVDCQDGVPETVIYDTDYVIVYAGDGSGLALQIPVASILKLPDDADLKLSIMDNPNRLGANLEHITRVTGYFSKVAGWNPGKRGELRDRHKGWDAGAGEWGYKVAIWAQGCPHGDTQQQVEVE